MVGENNHSVARRLTALTAAICTLGSLALVPMANAADAGAASGSASAAAEQQNAQQPAGLQTATPSTAGQQSQKPADQSAVQQLTQQPTKPNASDMSDERTPDASAPDEQQPTATGVASIGDKSYSTLKDAIAAVPDKGVEATVITLMADFSESVEIPAGKMIVLDLNGHVLTNTHESDDPKSADYNKGTQYTISNNGTLTLRDSSPAQTGTVDNVSNGSAAGDIVGDNAILNIGGDAIVNNYGGTMTIESGNYTRSRESSTYDPDKYETGNGPKGITRGDNAGIVITNNGAMTITGGNIRFTDNQNVGYWSPLIQNGMPVGTEPIEGQDKAVLNLSGGVLTGGYVNVATGPQGVFNMTDGVLDRKYNGPIQAVQNWNGEVNLTGGRIAGGIYSQGGLPVAAPDAVVNIGGNVVVSIKLDSFPPKYQTRYWYAAYASYGRINITGGVFDLDSSHIGVFAGGTGSVVVSGGAFTNVPDTNKSSSGETHLEKYFLKYLKDGVAPIEKDGKYVLSEGVSSAQSLTISSDAAMSAGKIPVLEGSSVQLHAKTDASKDVTNLATWSVKDSKIATVDANGVVKGVSRGSTTVIATIKWLGKDGEQTLTADIPVTVYPKSVPTPPSSGSGPTYVTGLTVSSKPNKLEYKIGEQFDGTGMVIKYQPSNGSSYVLGPDQYAVTLDTSKPGKVKAFVTLNSDPSKATSFEVTVVISDVKVHRLYNPRSGEHFYVSSENEYNALLRSKQWRDEGIGFTMVDYGTPVYRLYNPGGKHLFTTSVKERDVLIKGKWRYEGVAFYVPEGSKTEVHRLYNPGSGDHLLTTSANERGVLVMHGWRDEGTAFIAK